MRAQILVDLFAAIVVSVGGEHHDLRIQALAKGFFIATIECLAAVGKLGLQLFYSRLCCFR